MAVPTWDRVKAVFEGAVALAPEARGRFLDEACGQDAELRREVDSLLASHQQAGSFLSAPARVGGALIEPSEPKAEMRRVGPYRVLGVAARGGMGTVYRAVRDDDSFEKTVAVKVIRAGAATEAADSRFRRERQILARLQHPNITTVFDGGTTADGQPYLVKEYVEGRPIVAWCDEHGLGTRERLRLFGSV